MDYDIIKLAEYFASEEKAYDLIESIRWPNGPVCPHCESNEKAYRINIAKQKRRVWKCKACRKQFSVMIGTIFEGSKIPLNKWLVAMYLMCSSKKSISANQLHRSLGITYKSAWFLCHRIRYAMAREPLKGMLKGIVEADETYVGGKKRKGSKRGRGTKKTPVLTLVERKGRARSYKLDNLTKRTIQGLIRDDVEITSHIMTDEFKSYKGLSQYFAGHSHVNHGAKEYCRGIVHVNFAESYFSLLKRAVIGAFHHVSDAHLPRYLSEFDFRWNTRKLSDWERTREALEMIEGKRLSYREPIAS